MKRPRCHGCGHPGGWRRVVAGNKKPCDCACHQRVERVRRHRRSMPGWWERYDDVEVPG